MEWSAKTRPLLVPWILLTTVTATSTENLIETTPPFFKFQNFPLANCTTRDIELVFIEWGNRHYRSSVRKTSEGRRFQAIYHEVMKHIVKLFMADGEESMGRIRVSLLSSDQLPKTPVSHPEVSGSKKPATEVFFSFHGQENMPMKTMEEKLDWYYDGSRQRYHMPPIQFVLQHLLGNASYGARNDSEKVIVMFQWNIATPVEDIIKERQLIALSDVKCFSFYMEETSNFNVCPDVIPMNAHFVTREETLKRAASYLCRRCYPGWLLWPEYNTCYKIFYQGNASINFLDAWSQCRSVGAGLVAMETKRELHFLEEHITQTLLANSTDESVDFFIGLRRNMKSLGTRFVWKEFRPLTYSHWLKGEPDGGSFNACAIWRFKRRGLDGFTAGVGSLQMNGSKNHWMDAECSDKIQKNIICEKEDQNYTIWKLSNLREDLAEPGDQSVEEVLRKGPFVYYSGPSLVSTYQGSVPTQSILALSQLHIFFRLHPKTISSTAGFFRQPYQTGFPLNKMGQNVVPLCQRVYPNLRAFHRVCDGTDDCAAAESYCYENGAILYRSCRHDEMSCNRNGRMPCVPKSAKCDLYKDCLNGEDERNCESCTNYLCHDGKCLPKSWLGDGQVDCPKGCNSQHRRTLTDENQPITEECHFICNRSQCVDSSMLTNNRTDCLGPEGPIDEHWGRLEGWECPGPAKGKRWAPRCILLRDRLGEMVGCRDGDHLQDCGNFSCPAGFVKCPASYCIPTYMARRHATRVKNCPFGEEVHPHSIIPAPPRNYFYCITDMLWVHLDLVCDGFAHCPHREDELECGLQCADGFICLGGAVTVGDPEKIIQPVSNISFIDKNVRHINLSYIKIPHFFKIAPSGRFESLLHLHLSGTNMNESDNRQCQIDYCNEIDKDFWNVRFLDLSHNRFRQLHSLTVLHSMLNLNFLNVSFNPLLTQFNKGRCHFMNEINILDLSHTAISVLDKVSVSCLRSLVYINLSHTQILVLTGVFPPTLKQIDLRNTPVYAVEPGVFHKAFIVQKLLASTYELCCPQLCGPTIGARQCYAPSDALSSCSDLLKETPLRILLWLVGLTACVSNVMSIVYRVTVDRDKLKCSYGISVTNLSFADFLMGTYLLLIASMDSVYRGEYVLHSRSWVTSTTCKVAGFLATMASETSAMFISLITVDRFLVIKFPFGEHRMSRAVTLTCSLVIWVIGFVIAVIPVLPAFDHWIIYSSNSMCLGLPFTTDLYHGKAYSVAIFIVFNFVIFLLIAAGQFGIYRAMIHRPSVSVGTANYKRRQQDMAVAKHLSFVAMSDFFCWFPIGIMGLLALSGYVIGNEAFAWSAVLILPFNSALNPVLYTVPALRRKWDEYRNRRDGHEARLRHGELTSFPECSEENDCTVASMGDVWTVSGTPISAKHRGGAMKPVAGQEDSLDFDLVNTVLDTLDTSTEDGSQIPYDGNDVIWHRF